MASEILQSVLLLNDLWRFLANFFNIEEIRSLSFDLGINFEDLPGETKTRKARELLIRLGEADEESECESKYLRLLSLLKNERSAFYPSLFDNLDKPEIPNPNKEELLARHYCLGRSRFIQTTKPFHEKALGRIGLEQRIGTGSILLLLGIFALLSFVLWRQIRPNAMRGDFNIAVAPFEVKGDVPAIGEDLANSIFGRLETNFANTGSPIVSVWGPSQPTLNPVPVVKGEDDAHRDHNAARLAAAINADIVVYGIVIKDGPGWEVIPRFYVSPNNFEEPAEILGPYDLGKPFGLPEGNRRALRITAGDELTPRAEFLTQLAIGLTYYSIENYDRASTTFHNIILAADDTDVAIDDGSLRLAYLMLGNSFLKMALREILAISETDSDFSETFREVVDVHLQQAELYFSESLDVDSNYARALLGLGDVAYSQAFDCEGKRCNLDPTSLDQAVTHYQEALKVPDPSPLAVVFSKGNFGLGQSYFQQSLLAGDRAFIDAMRHFNAVITDYGEGANPRAIDIAAESYARLGLIYCFQEQLEESVRLYEKAIELLSDQHTRDDNRLLSLDVRRQRIDTYERKTAYLSTQVGNPDCTSNPPPISE